MIFTKNKEGVRAVQAMKYKKYVAGKYTRERAPFAPKYTNRIFESKDGSSNASANLTPLVDSLWIPSQKVDSLN